MFKKVFASSVLLASLAATSAVRADLVEEISCDTDAIFAENSCNQCFNGGIKSEGAVIGNLTDLWVNNTGKSQVIYEETNFDKDNLPKMTALNGAVWEQDSVDDKFWEKTPELQALFDAEHQGYVLKTGEQVNWIKSVEGASYHLAKNTAEKNANIGLLVYSLNSLPILDDGEKSTDVETHKECVLFKSGDKPSIPVNEKPKELPKTGPEQFFLLLLLAMFLAFGILRFKKG